MTATASDASFSLDGVHRWWLSRSWRPLGLLPENPLVSCGLNPSDADATKNDPTIRREIAFAKAWGHDGLIKVNAFALVSSDPRVLKTTAFDSVGDLNDDTIRTNCRGRTVLVCWGAGGAYLGRAARVLEILEEVGAKPVCLGLTKDGFPRHPLYVKADVKPMRFVEARVTK